MLYEPLNNMESLSIFCSQCPLHNSDKTCVQDDMDCNQDKYPPEIIIMGLKEDETHRTR